MSDKDLVLVSGASGYIASHVVKLLQEDGYRVRGTVRSLKDEKKVKHLYNICPNAKYRLELVEADLLDAESWTGSVTGCTYVQHIASPFPIANPRNENEVIKPAVDGTLNVLRAAAESGTVKRVVLTSSISVITACGGNTVPYTEKDWMDDKTPGLLMYVKSKILAERAAWEFWKEMPVDKRFELAVVNPTFVIGPPLHGTPGSSTDLVKRLLQREMPAVPRLFLAMVDVRDVALAHVKCMTLEEAVGHRHILHARTVMLIEFAKALDKEFKRQGYNVPTRQLPDFLTVMASWFDKMLKSAWSFASKEMLLDTTRMRDVLGIQPRDLSESFIDMAYAMIDNGFVKKTRGYRGRPDQASQLETV